MTNRTIPFVGELRDNDEHKLTPAERDVERERQRVVRVSGRRDHERR